MATSYSYAQSGSKKHAIGSIAKSACITKPVIGVCGPDEGGTMAWICTRFMIWLQGGRAVRITPKHPQRIDALDGLVLGGGADINPSRYKEERLTSLKRESQRAHKINATFIYSVLIWILREFLSRDFSRGGNDLARDELELSLLREATERRLPVLGICRGSQLINVFYGGSLFQNVKAFYVETPQLHTVRPRKLIQIEPGTTLARIIEKNRAKVNSLHNQSVKKLGDGLRISARETNGVVQAIEHRNLPFLIGVQWHPEFLPFIPEQRRVFHHFVEASCVYRFQAELCP
jgi:putative glutamine amidotransferase